MKSQRLHVEFLLGSHATKHPHASSRVVPQSLLDYLCRGQDAAGRVVFIRESDEERSE